MPNKACSGFALQAGKIGLSCTIRKPLTQAVRCFMPKSTYDENWLINQMSQANPPCWRCGKPGKRCTVEYTRSDRSREKVFCDKCADIVTRQHKYIVKFHAPNKACSGLAPVARRKKVSSKSKVVVGGASR